MLYWLSAAVAVVGFLFFFSVGVLTCWRRFQEWLHSRRELRSL